MNEQKRSALDTGMTVGALIGHLNGMDQQAIVLFTCDYGDHNHTLQALPVQEIEESDSNQIRVTAFSRSEIARDYRPDEIHEDDEDPQAVVFLA